MLAGLTGTGAEYSHALFIFSMGTSSGRAVWAVHLGELIRLIVTLQKFIHFARLGSCTAVDYRGS